MAWLCGSPAPRRQDGTVFVAVVGTGISGLAATKCCLGPPSSAEEGRASIYRTIFTNSCEEMMYYSDFAFSDDHPNYMQNARLQYDICKAVHAPLVSEMMDDVDEKMGMYTGKKLERKNPTGSTTFPCLAMLGVLCLLLLLLLTALYC